MATNFSSSSRQQIRDFVRANRWNGASQPISAINHGTGSTEEERERLAIYKRLRQDTSYPLPIIPKLSVEMKKDRLRNAYRACLISNEILKQLNHEAEVYTNIVAVRHRVRTHKFTCTVRRLCECDCLCTLRLTSLTLTATSFVSFILFFRQTNQPLRPLGASRT
jgi:hypothetical protein